MSSLSIDVSQTVRPEDLEDFDCTNNYFENIFQLEDFILYRGICHFYKRDFKDAQVNFKKCLQLKQSVDKKAEEEKTI